MLDPAIASFGAFAVSVFVLIAQGVSMRQDATVRRDLDEKIRGIRDKIDSFINDSHRDSSRIRERLSAVEARLRSAEEVVLMCRQCNPHQHQRGHPHAYHGPFEPPEESTTT